MIERVFKPYNDIFQILYYYIVSPRHVLSREILNNIWKKLKIIENGSNAK